MAKPYFKELSRRLAQLREDGLFIDGEISMRDKSVNLHRVLLAIFSIDIKERNQDNFGHWSIEAPEYCVDEVNDLVQFLYDGESDINEKCKEIIKSLNLDLTLDKRIHRKTMSKRKGEHAQVDENLELRYLRNLTFEMGVPKLLKGPNCLFDISIRTGKDLHKCHKCIIASMSEYFAVMFQSGMKETQDKIINLQGVETDAFLSALNYIYTGMSPLTTANAPNVLATAVYLQVSTLQALCEEFLAQQIDENNAVEIWKLGSLYGCTNLVNSAMSFITNNFNHINRLQLVRNLQMDDVINVINDENLNVNKEDEVLRFVLEWISRNKADSYVEKLLKYVRLTLVEGSYLQKVLNENVIIQTSQVGTQMIKHALMKQTEGMLEEDPRKEEAFVVLKKSPYLKGIDIGCYSLRRKVWYRLQSFKSSAGGTGFAACSAHNNIYVTGGMCNANRFYKFSIDKNHWTELENMNEPRSAHAMACVGENIYVLGGSNIVRGSFTVISSVEKYVPNKTAWFPIGHMSIPTYDSAFAVVKSRILIFGGSIGSRSGLYIKDIQCFDTVTETCSTLYHNLPFTLSLAVACVSNRDIYIACPIGQILHYNEEAPPTLLNKSKGSQSMGFGALYHNHAIYIFGGYSMLSESNAIHKFDLNSKRQTVSSETKLPFKNQSNQFFTTVMHVSRKFLDKEFHT